MPSDKLKALNGNSLSLGSRKAKIIRLFLLRSLQINDAIDKAIATQKDRRCLRTAIYSIMKRQVRVLNSAWGDKAWSGKPS